MDRDKVVASFNNHCAPLFVRFTKAEETHNYIFSTFLISVDGEWFMITAGHCIREIADSIKHGYAMSMCRIIDSVGSLAVHNFPIPFDYEASIKMYVDELGYDYGLIHVSTYYRNLMKKNNIKPLDDTAWQEPPLDPEYYFLLGVPDQLTKVSDESGRITSSFHSVKALKVPPAEFEKTEAPTFFGEISMNDSLSSISGMSGGPLFSFKRTESGEYKYWLYGVQSRWIRSTRTVAACLMEPFALVIKDKINEFSGKIKVA